MPRRSYKNSPGKKSGTGKKAGGSSRSDASQSRARKSTVTRKKVAKKSAKKSAAAKPTKKWPSSRPTTKRQSDDVVAEEATTPKTHKPSPRTVAAARAAAPPKTAKPSKTTRDQPQRLQRLLAAAGFGSRRQCESMIEEGRVEINGNTISKMGTTVDPKQDKVRVDGVPLRQQKLVYYLVNKPTGVLSTNSDPQGRERVIDLVPNSERVFPVGRLDQSSQGLMLLTNDGDLAQQLAHPKYGVRKVYRVTVAGKIDGETMRSMRKGIHIAEGFVRVEGAKILKTRARATEMEITLREGKNREIRRILARLGHKVQVLRRIAIGPLRLGDIPVGAHRLLTREEVTRLRTAIEHSRVEVEEEAELESSRPKSSKFATKRTSKKSSAAGKRTGRKPKRAEGRNDVVARRTSRKPTTTKFSFKPKKSDDGGGSVIGGD